MSDVCGPGGLGGRKPSRALELWARKGLALADEEE